MRISCSVCAAPYASSAPPVFDGATEKDIRELLEDCGFSETGKLRLRDGRTGEWFARRLP